MRVIMNMISGCPKVNKRPPSSSHDDSESDDYYTVEGSESSSQRKVRPKLYWTSEKRNVIYQIFQEEMNNRSLRISQQKIKKAIKRLNETKGSKTEARIRTFVHRIRNELIQNTDSGSGDESLRAWYWTEERRRIIKTMLSDEIQDRRVPLTKNKIRQVLVELKEEPMLRNELRVRNFIYRLRAKERARSQDSDSSATQFEEKCKSVVVDIEVYEHYLKCPLVNKNSSEMEA